MWKVKLALFAYRKLRSYIANKGTDTDTVEHDQPAPIERPTPQTIPPMSIDKYFVEQARKHTEGVQPYFEVYAEIDEHGKIASDGVMRIGKVFGVEFEDITLAEWDIDRVISATDIAPPDGSTVVQFRISRLVRFPHTYGDGRAWGMECDVVGYGDDPEPA